MAPRTRKDPLLGGGAAGNPPKLERTQRFDDLGSYGLRAFSGYVREEFLPQLMGRSAQRVYREMLDNSPVVGAVMFAITQAMRKVTWRVEPANDSAEAEKYAEFVDGLMHDMSHTWEDFVQEMLSMLGYGFSVHEIVYKRRLGHRPETRPGPKPINDPGSSKFDDGKVGWRRLPIRGQDTILKWFFDENGQIRGVTQQPYAGPTLDIPIEKCLLFRSGMHKNNPEGKSVLRNAYRPYYFIKRFEELEAVNFERMNGFPVMYIPSENIERALAIGENGQPIDPVAAAAYDSYKELVTNVRIDEQMGAVLPSNTWQDSEGKPSAIRQYELQFLTPQHGATSKADANTIINRYNVQIMYTVLADFIQMGHEVRGTNNLAVTKVDMFYQAIEGWLNSGAAVINRYGLPRLWNINKDPIDLMPQLKPDMAQRLDLDSLGAYITALGAAGMPLFPDDELQTFLREAGGLPEETPPELMTNAKNMMAAELKGAQEAAKPQPKPAAAKPKAKAKLKKKVADATV